MENKQLRNIKGAGRPAGSPNKSTALAREAIARFVDGNSYKLQEWLDSIAKTLNTALNTHLTALCKWLNTMYLN